MLATEGPVGHVVGHLATIRPWFEMADPLPAGRGPAVVEVGLSIVHPSRRGQQVQGALALATVLDHGGTNPDLRGFCMKCVTSHPYSQMSSRRFNGRATALFPAGVPAWVHGDASDPGIQIPMTTILLHCPFGEPIERDVPLPEALAPFVQALYAWLGLPRRVRPVRSAKLPDGETRIATWFDSARRQGVAAVRSAGPDLAREVLERVDWFIGGHMEHVTVLLPLASPGAAAAVPELEAGGLFFGGVIPDLEGTDTMVLERVESPQASAEDIHVVGPDAEALRDRVLEGWRQSRERTTVRAIAS